MNNIMKIIVLSSSFLCATEQGSELSFNLSDRQQIDNSRHSIENQIPEAISFYEKHKKKKLSDEEYNWFLQGSLKTAFKLMDTDLQNQVTLAYIHRYGLGKLTDTVSLDRRIESTEATDPFSNKANAQAHIGLGNARADNVQIPHYRQALELTKDPELQAQAHIGLGNARDGGRVAHYREALELTKDPELHAQAHIGLGNARDGDRVAHYREALELTKDPELHAQAHIGLGNARDGRDQGVAHYIQALNLTNDRELQAQAHIGLGNARDGRASVAHYRQALKLTQDPELQAQAHIGLCNARDGDRVAHYKKALNLTQDPELRAQALIGLGNARDGGANNVAHYREALKLTSELSFNLSDRQQIDNSRHSIENQIPEAISFYEKHKEKKLSGEEYWFFRGSLKQPSN